MKLILNVIGSRKEVDLPVLPPIKTTLNVCDFFTKEETQIIKKYSYNQKGADDNFLWFTVQSYVLIKEPSGNFVYEIRLSDLP